MLQSAATILIVVVFVPLFIARQQQNRDLTNRPDCARVTGLAGNPADKTEVRG